MLSDLKDVYIRNSMIPKRYLDDITLEPCSDDLTVFDELFKIRDHINEFVVQGKNLLIYSPNVGNGKTTIATKMLKSYIDVIQNVSFKHMCPALFINVNSVLNMKKLAISNSQIKDEIDWIESSILTSKLVVFDDLGVKNISDYDMGNLYYWIDTRTNNCLSSIYTSNLTPEQLKNVLDPRIYSRVINYSIIKEIKDGDHRNVKSITIS